MMQWVENGGRGHVVIWKDTEGDYPKGLYVYAGQYIEEKKHQCHHSEEYQQAIPDTSCQKTQHQWPLFFASDTVSG